jgi:lipopolysaccharide biosynthesis glycosyltransferase
MKRKLLSLSNNAIFMVFDDLYFHYFRACINSIRQNYPDYPTLLICYTGNLTFVKKFISDIPRAISVSFLPLEKQQSLTNFGTVNSPLIYQRYRLWTDEFNQYDKILHLDVDTLILKPLDIIFYKDTFFIVKNNNPVPFSHIFNQPVSTGQLRAMLAEDGLEKIDDQESLACAGLFMVPRKYRTKKHFSQLISLTTKYSKFLNFADQSAISLWCVKNNIKLSGNFLFHFQNFHLFASKINQNSSELLEKIYVLHFSFMKPDMRGYAHFFPPSADVMRKLFFNYLFSDVPVILRYVFNYPRYLFFRYLYSRLQKFQANRNSIYNRENL